MLRTRDGRRDAWNGSLAMASDVLLRTCEVLEALKLPPDLGEGAPTGRHALRPTGLMPGWHIWPGFWAGAGYPALRDALRDCLPNPEKQLVIHPYDWRLSSKWNARLLLDRLEPRLAEWRSDGGGPEARLQLVCHSMGGLIGRYFLHVLGGKEITRRVYTLGAPYSGSMRALRVLTGCLLPSAFGRFNERLREVAQTFPSIAELLPAYACVTGIGDHGRSDADRLVDHVVPGLDQQAVQRSADFHAELAAQEESAPHGLLHVFGGDQQPTEQAVVIDPPNMRFVRRQRGEDFGGDGTVPRFSCVPPHWEDDSAATFYPASHVGLTRHEDLLRNLVNKINAVRPERALSPPRPLSLLLPPVAVAGRKVPIHVHADEAQLVLDARLHSADGTLYGHPVALLPDGAGNYTADLAPPPGVWHVTVETSTEAPSGRVEDLLVVAQS
ncbi:hypothetical protein [Streptomyces sp. NPDC005322]|uniref:lipase/acyltransferase domain-containing protein n=1 Tax=Streptomyces sp. NPDC005322 TaxID=3157032 RepID=UPI0033A44E6B